MPKAEMLWNRSPHLHYARIGARMRTEYTKRGEDATMNSLIRPRAYGYARVHQAGVDGLVRQTEPLTRYIAQLGNYEHDPAADLVVDVAGGSGDLSPKLRRLLARLRPGDLLVVTQLDRLGRALTRIRTVENSCRDAGAELVILDGVQMDPALGRLMEQIGVTFGTAGWKGASRRVKGIRR